MTRHRPKWTRREAAVLARLDTPGRIQAYLDGVPYSDEPIYRSPRSVMRDRKAHCFDGALFAAAALRTHGHVPLLMDLRAVRDDDHILAVYEARGCYGALAKSNFVGLRLREPVFRNLRELALSYFHDYFNVAGEKTLRAYSALVDLSRFDHAEWSTSDAGLESVARGLDTVRHYPLATLPAIRALTTVDKRTLAAGLLGANPAGLYCLDGG